LNFEKNLSQVTIIVPVVHPFFGAADFEKLEINHEKQHYVMMCTMDAPCGQR